MKETKIIKDLSNESLVFKTSQEVGGLLDDNKRERNAGQVRGDGVVGRKVASVPTAVLDSWIDEGVDWRKVNDPGMMKKLQAKLNDPDNRLFRTNKGHIG
jgi:hypothetical protein